jgi:bla regulator protein BlaR1
MEFVLPLAAKSLVVAAVALGLLKIAERRSASDRSLIAHLALLALALLPLAAIALPALEVVGPAFLRPAPVEQTAIAASTPTAPEVAVAETMFRSDPAAAVSGPVDWAFWAYVAPAALLVLLTLIAVGRLVILKARANVLVDPHWLSALAQAQRRMGFKNGTALLTSNELRSPVSWGLMRPVIVLNGEAVQARSEAEAIIAHELAHVTRLDWVKLLLSRIVVAMYWFNPLVWVLAREAHQLREEAADDAVLASNIEDTEYAKLLVGIARHECRGLLIGAHGVAPSRKSLSRRVRRVLDAASARAPGGWRWSSAAAFFAAGMAVPIAALQFVEPTMAASETRPATVASADHPDHTFAITSRHVDSAGRTTFVSRNDTPNAGSSYYPVRPVRPVVPVADVERSVRIALAEGRDAAESARSAIDRAIELKAVGATAAYAAAMREALPRLDHDDIVQLKAIGATPEYVRDLARSGYRNLDSDDIAEARAMNIDGAYIRGMAAAGYGRLSMDQLVELRAAGVTPGDVARYRRVSRQLPSVDDLIEAKAAGLNPEDIDPDGDP